MMPGKTAHPPRCSVVIRAYNEQKHLGRLLDGLGQQTIRELEIILVDSGSTDGTLEVAARYPVQVEHISAQEFTFGRSLNRGIAAASAEWIVIASAHVYPVYPDWLERLLEPLADPRVALVYGKQRGDHHSQFSEQQIFTRWYPDQAPSRQAHPFCNNANAAIRRSLWQERPYDETLSGLEDLDWANWAISQGYQLAYVPEAEIIHVHHETPQAVYNRYRREAMAYKHIFPHERFGRLDLLRLATTNILSDVWHAARARKLRASLKSIFWFRWMQFWGTYQGYRHSGPLTWQLRQTFYYPPQLRGGSPPDARGVRPIQYHDLREKP
jgi:rhamnosyltransferase